MKLWQKNYQVDQEIERFTVGRDRELDLELAPYDIQGSLAHIKMLCEVGLLEKPELEELVKGLQRLYKEVEAGRFTIEEGIEDVHSQVEHWLIQNLGEIGKKIHSGRSRNDQVLVDLKLYLRAQVREVIQDIEKLFETLISLSEQHKDQLLPGYTHLQVAMVSSFGLWFGAYAESLVDDLQQWLSTFKIINQNPLGSAAGYGSSFPLDRKMTTDLLGFADLNYNVVHAQMGRGKSELFMAFSLSATAHTLGKMAMDVCLFINQNFGFIAFPDELTTGSSIMPHKKNPDVFEIIRGRCNQLIALPTQVSMLTTNLPSGYHREFQLLKEVLFPAIHQLKDCLQMAAFALEHIQIKDNILAEDKYRYLYSVEEVNRLVLEGTPFRDAYKIVGQQIADGSFDPDRSVAHTHAGSLGNLCNDAIQSKWQGVKEGFKFDFIDKRVEQLLG